MSTNQTNHNTMDMHHEITVDLIIMPERHYDAIRLHLGVILMKPGLQLAVLLHSLKIQ